MPAKNLTELQVFVLSLFVFFCFGTHDALSKMSGSMIGFAMTAFLIQISRVICVLIYASYKKNKNIFYPNSKKGAFYYGLMNSIGMMGFYFAVINIPLVELFIIILLRPVITSILAKIFLKEQLSGYHIIAIMLGIIGALIAFQIWNIQSFNYNMIGILGAFVNVFAMSIRYILVKKTSHQEDVLSLILYSGIILFLISIPFVEQWNMPPLNMIFIAMLAGFFTVCGEVVSIKANHSNHVIILSIGQYSILFWIILYGWLLFSEQPSVWAIIASGFIIGSGVMLYINAKRKSFTYQHPVDKI